jgi:hypothetical protein
MTETLTPPAQVYTESNIAPDVHHLAQGVGSWEDYQQLRAAADQIRGGEQGGFVGPDGVALNSDEARRVTNIYRHPQQLILSEGDTNRLLSYSSRLGGVDNVSELGPVDKDAFDLAVSQARAWGVEHPEALTPDELSAIVARRVSLSERLLQQYPRKADASPTETGELIQTALRGVGDAAVGTSVEEPVTAAAEQTAQLPAIAPEQPSTPELPPEEANADTIEFTPEMVAKLKKLLDDKTYAVLGLSAYELSEKGIGLFDGAELDYDRIAQLERRDARRGRRQARTAAAKAYAGKGIAATKAGLAGAAAGLGEKAGVLADFAGRRWQKARDIYLSLHKAASELRDDVIDSLLEKTQQGETQTQDTIPAPSQPLRPVRTRTLADAAEPPLRPDQLNSTGLLLRKRMLAAQQARLEGANPQALRRLPAVAGTGVLAVYQRLSEGIEE